jgi:hypothetical protein
MNLVIMYCFPPVARMTLDKVSDYRISMTLQQSATSLLRTIRGILKSFLATNVLRQLHNEESEHSHHRRP